MPVPDWYPILDLAKEWGVPPWVIEDGPADWVIRALTVQRIRSSTTVSRE